MSKFIDSFRTILNEEGEVKELYKNDDHDFGDVIKFSSTEQEFKKIRCIDGIERVYEVN